MKQIIFSINIVTNNKIKTISNRFKCFFNRILQKFTLQIQTEKVQIILLY